MFTIPRVTQLTGKTALILAATQGRTDVAMVLMRQGADITAVDRVSAAAARPLARRVGPCVANVVVACRARSDSEPRCTWLRWRGMRLLLRRCYIGELPSTNRIKCAHLWGPTRCSHSSLSRMSSSSSQAGETPLQLAARYGKADCIAVLLLNDADIRHRNRVSWSEDSRGGARVACVL
jgi:Ankyrin repeat